MGSSGRKSHKTAQMARRSPGRPRKTATEWLTGPRKTAAELYGRGFRRAAVATTLVDVICPPKDPPEALERRLKRTRNRLRQWERDQRFRDYLFSIATIEVDLASRDILKGVTNRAKEGSVDAAKFAMEIAGRYTPKGEQVAPNISITFAGLPRPQRRELEEPIEDAEVVEDED